MAGILGALFFISQFMVPILGEKVLGMIREDGSWKTFFEQSPGMTMDLGVHPLTNGDRFLLGS
jgi:hypothetical protein